ncbi:MAG: DUF3160 domain-containing protein [Patescibacteria group bacterium]
MFEGQETIIPSQPAANSAVNEFTEKKPLKKILLLGGLVLGVLVLGFGIWYGVSKYFTKKASPILTPVVVETASTSQGALPNLTMPGIASTTIATSTFSNIAVEYLSFADFYKSPDNSIVTKFSDYELPLNVKIDVLNYYDLSRKLSLDPVVGNLNTNGFAIIDNPWAKEAPDFYSIYTKLEERQIPFFISSDLILYYYQTTLKKVFKDIEENIFYDNLWNINKDLYNSAKNRYESRLASIGNINDSILEGERLEAAYFAVALELLKPANDQIAPKGTLDDKNKFVTTETERFYFVTPPYLKDDVLREVKLIREANENTKSPVMLYTRNYRDFVVPSDYRGNARLNNFYLTTKWLNSVFPLNYIDKNCPKCLLDKEDWRLGMIAASFISADFSDSPELKNEWARIYKVMSYFNPLREDLNYVFYRDALRSVFGEKYDIEELFGDKNPEAKNNLQKLQAKLNALEFSPFLGAIDKADPATNYRLGFKLLVEPYPPNDYILTHLTYPTVDAFLGTSTKANNLSACSLNNKTRRCNGIALDVINLIAPVTGNDYFSENTNYFNYSAESKNLVEKLNADSVWHTTNYWSTLAALSAYLNINQKSQPLFAQTLAWHEHSLNTALGAWVDMQLPLDKFSVMQQFKGQGFDDFSRFNDNSYVEPNLNLLNELMANDQMMQKMFSALQVNQEVVSVANALTAAYDNLNSLRSVVIKELSGEALAPEDNEIISNFAKQLTIEGASGGTEEFTLKTAAARSGLKENLGRLQLMVVVHQSGANKVFSVGPIWNYSETR